MEAANGPTRSLWMDTAETLERPRLRGSAEADICVIGAGITGVSVAYLLAREGREVLLIDDGAIGGGETSHTSAHLTTIQEVRYFDLEHLHGAEGARLAADSHRTAIETIESIVGLERIACDFERLDGFLFVPPGDPTDDLDKELEASHAAGLVDVEMVERAPIRPFHTGRALRYPNQGMFHPMAYLNGVVRAFERLGGRVHGGTHVTELQDDGVVRIKTRSRHTIRAKSAVVATNSPIHLTTRIHTKQAPYRTYAIGVLVPRDEVTAALYYDTADPYHYVRLQRLDRRGKQPADVLIVGGEDHKTGAEDDANERFARLETWARERFPIMDGVVWTWSGQVLQPIDGVAYIGRDKESKNVYFATGDAGMGMTHGTIAGRLLTDLIQGRENPWSRLYDPDRQTLRAMGRYLSENLQVAKDFAGRITGGDVGSVDEIPAGSGAVIRHGLHKVAVYRDEKGRLHERSAVCPHLGCVVAWNSSERSWDCPCHGSRFDPYGRVLNGPATGNLEAAEKRKDERAA